MVDPTEFSKLPSYLLSAWKQKKADEEATYIAACAAMTVAINTLPTEPLQDTGPVMREGVLDYSERLLKKTPREWAGNVQKFATELKIKNPSNTKFLTEVLKTTTDFINHPNNQDAFNKYETMREEVATKFGRYTGLSVALMGLPVSIFVGGIIGTAFLAVAFPPALPAIVVVGTLLVVFGALASTMPTDVSRKISQSWDDLKKEIPKPISFGR